MCSKTDATGDSPRTSEHLDHSQSKTFFHKQDNSNIIDRGLLVNIQGLPYNHMTKVNYLNDLELMKNFLFMSLTETHSSPNILDAEINIQDFNILKQDRKARGPIGHLFCHSLRNDDRNVAGRGVFIVCILKTCF